MTTSDGRFWIVFNGEIYNFIELRADLEQRGHTFRTASDTEVLLAAYREWGTACLDRLNGMWAFVIYDCVTRQLFGARDRFGVKPLYYSFLHNGAFAFASEIKALLTLDTPAVNDALAWDYLALGYVEHCAETMFAGIEKLPPAHSFTLDVTSGSFATRKYYSLPAHAIVLHMVPRRLAIPSTASVPWLETPSDYACDLTSM